MIRIVVADDHPIIRKGMLNILSSESDMNIVFEAADGLQVIDYLQQHKADIVILDIMMPEMNGLKVLEWIKKRYPKIPVIMVSSASENIYLGKSLKLGASGFINKENAHLELVDAIRKALTGALYYNEEQTQKVESAIIRSNDPKLHSLLSGREYQIFVLIGKGMNLTEIGEDLSLSVKTVSTFKSRIMSKMNFLNTSEIVRYCLEENIT
ncbi:MAG: response regulator transcription factor [Bacteroidota bacterium]